MTKYYMLLPVAVVSLLTAFPSVAADKPSQVISDIPNLSEIKLPLTEA
ncbi:MAG: hypothetical protein ICV78_05580, partial [Tolypothrix sp. Co-bin9]|nr:hypothetical protein [Tolypothrix sp. Co-bin9]